MPQFRKKPVVIDAVQSHAADPEWPDGVARAPDGVPIIVTLEGPHLVGEGDWVITGVQGERYACKDEIFRLTYDAVDEQPF